jgi:hypothetical protein
MREGRRTLDDLLAEARAKVNRLTPTEALAAVDGGALVLRHSLGRRRGA